MLALTVMTEDRHTVTPVANLQHVVRRGRAFGGEEPGSMDRDPSAARRSSTISAERILAWRASDKLSSATTREPLIEASKELPAESANASVLVVTDGGSENFGEVERNVSMILKHKVSAFSELPLVFRGA